MKERHIKTIHQKYGLGSVKKHVYRILDRTIWANRDKNLFEALPNMGTFYITDDPEVYNKLIHCREKEDVYVEETDTELYKAKVIEVKERSFVYAHYDDHHHDICILSSPCNDWLFEGNIIKKKQNEVD